MGRAGVFWGQRSSWQSVVAKLYCQQLLFVQMKGERNETTSRKSFIHKVHYVCTDAAVKAVALMFKQGNCLEKCIIAFEGRTASTEVSLTGLPTGEECQQYAVWLWRRVRLDVTIWMSFWHKEVSSWANVATTVVGPWAWDRASWHSETESEIKWKSRHQCRGALRQNERITSLECCSVRMLT